MGVDALISLWGRDKFRSPLKPIRLKIKIWKLIQLVLPSRTFCVTVKVFPVSNGTVQLTGSGDLINICSGDLTLVGSGGDFTMCSQISGAGNRGLAADMNDTPAFSFISSAKTKSIAMKI